MNFWINLYTFKFHNVNSVGEILIKMYLSRVNELQVLSPSEVPLLSNGELIGIRLWCGRRMRTSAVHFNRWLNISLFVQLDLGWPNRDLTVSRLCLVVIKGESFGFLWVNAADKSTTFKILIGDIRISNYDATSRPDRHRNRLVWGLQTYRSMSSVRRPLRLIDRKRAFYLLTQT